MELADCGIDAVNAEVVVGGECLIVSHASEDRLGIVGSGSHGGYQVPDVLIEVGHLDVGMGVVESDSVVQRLACHRDTDSGSEITLHVISEIETEDQKFAGAASAVGKHKTCSIEVDDGGACVGESLEGGLVGILDCLRCNDEGIKS